MPLARTLTPLVPPGPLPAARGEAVVRLRIEGLHCAACASIVEAALSQVPGVVDVRVSAQSERVRVCWRPAQVQLPALAQRLAPLGYRLAIDRDDAAQARRRERQAALWRLFVAGFCMMQVMMLALPAYLAAPGEIPSDQLALLVWGSWVMSLPVVLFSAAPFFANAGRQLRAGRIGMDTPVALAVAVAFGASSIAAADPAGPLGAEVWFDSLTMFVFLLLGARTLEQRARHRVAAELEQALERLPAAVQVVNAGGETRHVMPDQLQPGDHVRVSVGEAFAADGVLLEGRTRADEALLSGESAPCLKGPGDAVVAGSLNLEAPVLMQVRRAGADTRYQAIVTLMQQALELRPALLHSADRVASGMLAGVLLLAALGALAWAGVDASRAVRVAVAVLVVTCPCALSLAAPSALLVTAGVLARRGVLVQRLDALESLAHLQELFIDKTGTLTDDRLEFAGACALDGSPRTAEAAATVIRNAAALAVWSQHPLSRSLVERARAHGIPVDAAAGLQVEELAGQGLRAVTAQGVELRLGSAAWLGLGASRQAPASCWFRGADGVVHGLQFRECLRADAAAAVQALRADGVQLRLLSGDRPDRVEEMARRLGIEVALGAMSPEDKLAVVRAAQARGSIVGMIGDGLNDGPALAQAGVSIAMGQGASVARCKADLVLMSMRLGDVRLARHAARRTLRVMRQNFAGAIAYNLTCIPLALAGALPPWLAGAGMALSSLAVMANALRLRTVG